MVLYFVLRCCVLFWNLLVVFRCRIEFIENICRKLFSQYRPAGNDAVVMVNESHTIDSADRVNAENRVDILRFEQSPELPSKAFVSSSSVTDSPATVIFSSSVV